MKTSTDINDYDAICRVIQHYIDGAKTGKGALMKPTFHDEATIFGYVGADLFAGPVQGLYDWNDVNGPSKDIVSHIVSIDVVETVASVRVEFDNWTGHRFTDFFNLLKVNGEWKVMNKVFHLHT
jgi:Putative lumazine-binding